MNAARIDLQDFGIKRCARCGQCYNLEGFYIRAGKVDSYCRMCRRVVNGNAPRKDIGVTYHARNGHLIPDATRKCRHCGKWLAAFREFWHGDTCIFCHQDGAR